MQKVLHSYCPFYLALHQTIEQITPKKLFLNNIRLAISGCYKAKPSELILPPLCTGGWWQCLGSSDCSPSESLSSSCRDRIISGSGRIKEIFCFGSIGIAFQVTILSSFTSLRQLPSYLSQLRSHKATQILSLSEAVEAEKDNSLTKIFRSSVCCFLFWHWISTINLSFLLEAVVNHTSQSSKL